MGLSFLDEAARWNAPVVAIPIEYEENERNGVGLKKSMESGAYLYTPAKAAAFHGFQVRDPDVHSSQ